MAIRQGTVDSVWELMFFLQNILSFNFSWKTCICFRRGYGFSDIHTHGKTWHGLLVFQIALKPIFMLSIYSEKKYLGPSHPPQYQLVTMPTSYISHILYYVNIKTIPDSCHVTNHFCWVVRITTYIQRHLVYKLP